MNPAYIDGSFAVLHPAEGRRGVLIIGSLGDEAMNAYRPLVFLAERFAEAGNPTLRLEYRGFGDSAGEEGEPGLFDRWVKSLVAAAAWLREHCGVEKISLVGVRIGAAIAARAACDIPDVESLILLAPVANGRRFLRELVLAAKTTAEIWQVDPRIEDGAWFEAHGLRVDLATRHAIDRLDIGTLPGCPAPLALVMEEPDGAAGASVVERLSKLGVETTHARAEGFTMMLRDPYENAVPHDAFAQAVAWHTKIGGQHSEGAPAFRPGGAVLDLGSAWERPVWFGTDNASFGIVCEPAAPVPGAPVVLIGNTGANPRYSNSRVAVMFARWLASHGIASLRIDGTGIGDSRPETGERGQPYSRQGDVDLHAALDALTDRFSGPAIVLGMCSGAYHALQTAFEDDRVRGLILVNLQKFVWNEGESLSVVQRSTFRTTRFYMQNAASAATFRRLLRGEINVTGISRALAGRVARRFAANCDPVLRAIRGQDTPVSRVRRQVRDLVKRSVPILFVLSGNDPGLDEIGEYFGAQGRQFRRLPNVSFHMLEGADHTLSSHWARQALLRHIAEYLHTRFGVAGSIVPTVDQPAEPKPHKSMPETVNSGFTAIPAFRPGPVAIDTSGGAA